MADQDTLRAQPRGRWLVVARVAWVLLAVLVMVLIVVGIPLEYTYYKSICVASCSTDLAAQLTPERVQALGELGLSADFYAGYNVTLEVIAPLVFVAVAAMIFWHRSDDRMGQFAGFTLLTAGPAIFMVGSLAIRAPALWLPANCLYFLGQASFVIFFYVFPNGRFVPSWTRWLALGSSIWWAASIFIPGLPLNFNGPAFLAFIPTLVVAQIYRYRRVSTLAQRQQTRWVVYGFVVAIGGFVAAIILLPWLVPSGALGQMIAMGIASGLLLLVPISIGVAVLRYRLFDIDIIIRRTLVYSLLTLTLSLVYLGCLLVSRTLIAPLAGGSELGIVASTLAIAALFNPLRRRVQNLIDKRFYRRKYDIAKVLAAFGATARDETDLDALTGALLHVIDETMQPELVGLWLCKTETRRTLNSTSPVSTSGKASESQEYSDF